MRSLDPRVAQCAVVLVAALVAGVSWQQGYRASVRAYRADQAKVAALGQRVSELEAMVQGAGGTIAWLVKANQQLAQLRGRFPRQGQMPQLLNTLVETTKAGELTLMDVTRGNLEPVQHEGEPVLIDGLPCYQLPVTLSAEGRYHDVLAALGRLTSDTFPGIVSIEQVDLQRKETADATLTATIDLHLYVLGAALPTAPDA